MNSKIYIFTFFLIYNCFLSQQIKISEMEALTVVDVGSFTDFVIKKKYQFFNNEDKSISFKFISPKDDIYLIRRTEKKDDTYIMYMINNSEEYSKIKQELNLDGYVFSTSENSEEGIHLNYKKLDNKFLASVIFPNLGTFKNRVFC